MSERYHAPLRSAYAKIRPNSEMKSSYQECLYVAVFPVSCTVDPELLLKEMLTLGELQQQESTTKAREQLEKVFL